MTCFGQRCLYLRDILLAVLMLAGVFAVLGASGAASGQRAGANAGGVGSASADAALLERAKKLVQGGDPQGAISLLELVDLHGSNAADIHALKGVCLALLARPVESAQEFDAAIALRPGYAPTYFSAGLAFASFNNLDGALDRLGSALKLDPKLPGARYNYALVLARAGRFAESERQAEVEIENTHRKGESLLDIWRLKARDAYSQKKWPETIVAYKKTLELDPGWPEAYGALGEALFSLNRTEEGRTMLEKSEALDPDNGMTHALLGRLYQDAGKTQRAIAELESALRLRPDDQDTIYRLYRLYSHTGDTANADRALKLVKDLTANRYSESLRETKASAWNNAGLELERQGDLAGALNKFDRAAEEDGTNLIFKRNAALILCRLGRTQEAIRRLRDVLDLDPDDAQTLQILSVANEYSAHRRANVAALPALEAAR